MTLYFGRKTYQPHQHTQHRIQLIRMRRRAGTALTATTRTRAPYVHICLCLPIIRFASACVCRFLFGFSAHTLPVRLLLPMLPLSSSSSRLINASRPVFRFRQSDRCIIDARISHEFAPSRDGGKTRAHPLCKRDARARALCDDCFSTPTPPGVPETSASEFRRVVCQRSH